MKILSWDVGIINLAYCLIDVSGESWSIDDWDIINLTNRESLKCVTCGKNASCYTDIENKTIEEQYYCKKHIPKDLNPPENISELISTESNQCIKCEWDGKECIKNSKSKCLINNKCYCTVHMKSINKKIIDSYKVKNLKKKAVGTIDIDTLKKELIKKLEDKGEFLNVDDIVIENQPSMKNPKMKAISSTLFDYFLIRGIFDKERLNTSVKKVKFMSPSNKLKLADDDDNKKLVKLKGNEAKSYKLTKSLGVKYCREMISKYKNWLTFFESNKKKDDLADCFLQGMYYISNS